MLVSTDLRRPANLYVSPADNVLAAVDIIGNHVDSGDIVCIALLDCRKAFDSLDHCNLLCRLSDFGMSYATLWLFHCNSSNWNHCMTCQDQFSS